MQDYCKSNQPISLKLGIITGPTNQKNGLTFGGDPVLHTGSRSLFHSPQHCKTGDLAAFLIVSG